MVAATGEENAGQEILAIGCHQSELVTENLEDTGIMPFFLAAPIIFNMPLAHPHSPLRTKKVLVRIHNF